MARVLVVDDEPDIRALVAMNLRMDGHEVVTAENGEAALDAAASDRPDLIVLDVMMPGVDGFRVLELLKANTAGLSAVPVVMLTARTDRLDRIRGGIEGAVVYVTKPFSVVELRQTVRDVLAGAPEDELRRRAQHAALADLARVEAGVATPSTSARPRLTRFEPQGPRAARPPAPAPIDRSRLSARQIEIADAVAAAPNLAAAAEALGVSRTFVYASLRRMAEVLDAPSGPALARTLRASAVAGR